MNGTLLASYTYDSAGTPVSVAVGPDPTNPTTTPRYWYVYNGHGDVVNLVDASGNIAASYAYDTWGAPTSVSEAIPNANGWVNPYRYDGRDGVRYDAADGLYWMAVRAYDPTIGRFISHDPLGRAPLFFADNPYVYAGNNPVSNVDPSGERPFGGNPNPQPSPTPNTSHRVTPQQGKPEKHTCTGWCQVAQQNAWDEIHKGMIVGGIAITLWIAACVGTSGLGCQGAGWIAAPTISTAVRDILDGIQTLHNLMGGVVGDTKNLVLSATKVALDILTLVLTVAGFRFFLKNAVRLTEGFGNLAKAIWALGRGLSTQTRVYLAGALTEIGLAAIGLSDLWTDVQNEWTNLSAFGRCVAKGYNLGCPE